MSGLLKWIALLAFAIAASRAQAHKPSDSYLTLNVSSSSGEVGGHWDIALRDLEVAIGLDANGDGAITWGELRQQSAQIFDYAIARLDLRADGNACVMSRGDVLTDTHSDGGYAVLNFTAACAAPAHRFAVGYRLLFDIDPSHRGLLHLGVDGAVRTAVLSPAARRADFRSRQSVALAPVPAIRRRRRAWHIWIGYDHLLFLISLLLPAVLVRRDGRWIPVGTLRSALLSVIAVVTAFTVCAFDHADAGRARCRRIAVASGRIGDRAVGAARGAQQRLAASARAGVDRSRSRSGSSTASASPACSATSACRATRSRFRSPASTSASSSAN